MGDVRPQASFTGGEFAPSLYGRIDYAKYYTGLRTCRNFVVQQYGGAFNRPGTRYCLDAGDMTKRVRLIPFQFSADQQYVIEFGHLYARIIFDGALVVDGLGAPIVLTTPYTSSDLQTMTDIDLLKYTQSADVMTICNQSYQPKQLSRLSATSWQFTDFVNTNGPFQELNIDEAKVVSFSATTGTVTITATADIFTSAHVGAMLYVEQMPDDNTLAWAPGVSIAINAIRAAGVNYYLSLTNFTTGILQPTVTEGTQVDGNGVRWQYLHSGFGIAKITGYTDARHVTATVVSTIPHRLITTGVAKNIEALTPGDGVSVPVSIKITAHGFFTGDHVTIIGVTGTTGVNGAQTITVTDANNFTIDGVFDNTAYTGGGTVTDTRTYTPTYKWAFEAWKADQGYPMAVGYYQQREVFAATPPHPQNLWFSRTKGFLDFGVSKPILDDDAMTYTLMASQVNEIRHILETTSLILFTSSGPFIIPSGQNSVITPSSVNFKKQGGNACAHLHPLTVGHTALFLQEKGSQVRSLGYSFQEDSFIGNDITLMSHHLFEGHTIVSWCYQEIPNNIVWAVRDDGVLLGLTYLPQQEVVAWHRHDTDGLFESVCCVTENGKDVVYAAVKRYINGAWKRYIERFDPRDYTALHDAYFVDCGLSYNGAPATTFSGLNHLEGKTVSILADGLVHPQKVVTSGAVTLDYAASVVHIGLPIQADIETLEVKELAYKKLINFVTLEVRDTLGIKAGPNANNLYEFKEVRTDYSSPPTLMNDAVDIAIPAVWQKSGRVFIRQDNPLPANILAVMPDVTTGGR